MYLPDTAWPNKEEDLSALEKYSFSPNIDEFFCKSCGTRMFDRGTKPGSAPAVITGVLQNEPNLLRYEKHIFVADTRDGGASMWLRKSHPEGNAVKRFTRRDAPGNELPTDWPSDFELPDATATAGPEFTPLYCHCRGVNLLLKGAADLAGPPPQKVPFYVDPKSYKYLASFDACDSCRISIGADMTLWTFASLTHIGFPAAEQASTTSKSFESLPQTTFDLKAAVASETRDPRLGTLEFYQSSPDVERYFCSRCAATVFYAVHERPNIVDIAIGLLDHPSGSRAEGLLHWSLGTAGHLDDVEGGWREHFFNGVKEEAEQWRIERGYPKTARRIKLESGDTSM